MKNYYQNNRYFKNTIDKYFEGPKWNIMNNNTQTNDYVDLDYPNKSCNKCSLINQFNNIDMLGNKKEQFINILKYKKEIPHYIPKTFIFTKSTIENIKHIFNSDKMWIIKPENSLARNGINIVKTYTDLEIIISKYKWKEWIIQEYISNPLLINNKKFHFRLYVIVIKNNNNIYVYFYNKGFMYFAQKEYTNKVLDSDVHLSGENNKESVKVFPEYFTEHFNKNIYDTKIIPQFKEIVENTILSVYKKIECPNNTVDNYKCFKMFGYDILVDDKYNLYLAEINARLISLKYPPDDFKNVFYTNILDLVTSPIIPNSQEELNHKNILFTHVTHKNNNYYLRYFYIIIVLIGLFFIQKSTI
jgi:hypothetical protein